MTSSTTSPTATPARCSTSPAPTTLGEACALLGELDLFPGAAPEREASRLYRRWAYESAALDLALRQNGLALGRSSSATRSRCASSARPDCPASTRARSRRPRRSAIASPSTRTLEFKLDPENDWDQALIDEIAELAPVAVLDLKGMYSGTPVDVDTDPKLYLAVAEKFPEAYLEDPDINDETRECWRPSTTGSPGMRRCTRWPT